MARDDSRFDEVDEVDPWVALNAELPPLPPRDQQRLEDLMRRVRRPRAPGDSLRHHFVPQFLQKRFATKDQQLLVTSLDGSAARMSNVTNIAVVTHLYTLIDEELGETVGLETLLAELDGHAARAIQLVSSGVHLPPFGSSREDLALWLSFQHVRDPMSRRKAEALADQTYKMDLSLVTSRDAARARLLENLGRAPTDEEIDELVYAATHLDDIEVVPHQNDLVKLMLDSALAMAPYFCQRRVSVIRYDEPGLVLCDRPLVLRQWAVNAQPGMGVGVATADEILLPIDRQTALILHGEPQIPEGIVPADLGYTIDDFNQCIVSNAAAEVYCHPDDADRLEKLVLPDANRPLFMVTGALPGAGQTDGVNAPPKRPKPRRYRSQ